MKRASYKEAIAWIAEMDSPADDGADDPHTVAELVTVCLVAELFAVERERIGRDVVRYRKQTERQRA